MMMHSILKEPVKASIGQQPYKVKIVWRNGELIADEPESVGGQDLGPDPFTLLAAALATCTLSTLKMYIDRKALPVHSMQVDVNIAQNNDESLVSVFERSIRIDGTIDNIQRERLLHIAKSCPISKLLEHQIQLKTTI